MEASPGAYNWRAYHYKAAMTLIIQAGCQLRVLSRPWNTGDSHQRLRFVQREQVQLYCSWVIPVKVGEHHQLFYLHHVEHHEIHSSWALQKLNDSDKHRGSSSAV